MTTTENRVGEGHPGCQAEQCWQQAKAFSRILLLGSILVAQREQTTTGLMKAEPCPPKIHPSPKWPFGEHNLMWKWGF